MSALMVVNGIVSVWHDLSEFQLHNRRGVKRPAILPRILASVVRLLQLAELCAEDTASERAAGNSHRATDRL